MTGGVMMRTPESDIVSQVFLLTSAFVCVKDKIYLITIISHHCYSSRIILSFLPGVACWILSERLNMVLVCSQIFSWKCLIVLVWLPAPHGEDWMCVLSWAWIRPGAHSGIGGVIPATLSPFGPILSLEWFLEAPHDERCLTCGHLLSGLRSLLDIWDVHQCGL